MPNFISFLVNLTCSATIMLKEIFEDNSIKKKIMKKIHIK